MPDTTDPEALTAFIMTVIQGLSVLARDGVQRKQLKAMIGVAMGAWPPEAAS